MIAELAPGVFVTPTVLVALTEAWFAMTFERSCACEGSGVDVRIEGSAIECGTCSETITRKEGRS